VENWLVKFIQQEMQILHVEPLVKHSRSMYRDFYFVLNVIHVSIYIVMLGCKPNINLELSNAFFQGFIQYKMEDDNVRHANATRLIVKKIQEMELETESFNWAKVGLKMTSISSVFPTFSHVFSNVIQSHQVVQVTEQLSLKFH
jgi:hypothetical protein